MDQRKADSIADFFDTAVKGLKKRQTGDPVSDEELDCAILLTRQLEKFSKEFKMTLLRYWSTMHNHSLENAYYSRKGTFPDFAESRDTKKES